MKTGLRAFGQGLCIVLLTLLTQLGGLAWLAALCVKWRLLAFTLSYAALAVAATWVAPVFGRVPLPCTGETWRMQSLFYCILNRHYATPEMADLLGDLGAAMAERHPGTVTLVLDASFPFLDGFPLLPHLSHDDGDKADLAFWYRDGEGYLRGATRSPIGYFAFEDGPTDCPSRWPTLRWDLAWLQPLWPALALDETRLRDAMNWLAADPRTGRIFLEPHLTARLGLSDRKIRFQGCRAARHDDHIHLELRR
ncbi:MAG: hypothetical protein AAF698_11375 [Pseudomonadota bacterium]